MQMVAEKRRNRRPDATPMRAQGDGSLGWRQVVKCDSISKNVYRKQIHRGFAPPLVWLDH